MDDKTVNEIECLINGQYMLFRAATEYEKSKKSRSVKISLYKILISPVLIYACETWTFSKINEYALECFERKILRKVYRLLSKTDIWRKGNSQVSVCFV